MAYEIICPTCQARLLLKDETAEKWLLCPRCLHKVPHPSPGAQARTATSGLTSITVLQANAGIPSVESDSKRTLGPAGCSYFIILPLTIFATIAFILAINVMFSLVHGEGAIGLLLWGTIGSVICSIAMTVLILIPIGFSLLGRSAPGAQPTSKFAAILLLVVLAPIAFAIVFSTVCNATVGLHYH